MKSYIGEDVWNVNQYFSLTTANLNMRSHSIRKIFAVKKCVVWLLQIHKMASCSQLNMGDWQELIYTSSINSATT